MFFPSERDRSWMRSALAEALKAACFREVPVGAVVVYGDAIVGRGFNRREIDSDPIAHAEILAIQDAAARLARWNLSGSTLYVTLEPCVMCAGAIWSARISRVVYGTKEDKTGAVHSRYELLSDGRLGRTVACVGGCLADESQALLRDFFRDQRQRENDESLAHMERCESG